MNPLEADIPTPVAEPRHTGRAMWRGWRGLCPRCGTGRIFQSYVSTCESCSDCGLGIHHHRADDLPAYLVIFIMGHVVVSAFMGLEAAVTLSMWQHLAIWAPLMLAGSLALLRPVKGAVIGLQWALRMGGFDDEEKDLPANHRSG